MYQRLFIGETCDIKVLSTFLISAYSYHTSGCTFIYSSCLVEECSCMCIWCQESREHYLQGVCDCATCNQGVSHRSVMSRCNCTQCREFRSHSGFKRLQHTQSCTACQVCICVNFLFGGLLIPLRVCGENYGGELI